MKIRNTKWNLWNFLIRIFYFLLEHSFTSNNACHNPSIPSSSFTQRAIIFLWKINCMEWGFRLSKTTHKIDLTVSQHPTNHYVNVVVVDALHFTWLLGIVLVWISCIICCLGLSFTLFLFVLNFLSNMLSVLCFFCAWLFLLVFKVQKESF